MSGLPQSVPDDIALKIASFLQVADLCALASCSRFWRKLCRSDYLWESLVRDRWTSLVFSGDGSSSSTAITKPISEGWRAFYIRAHNKMAATATSVVQFVEYCPSSEWLEVHEYLKPIEDLHAVHFGFKDVEMFMFQPKLTAILNMIGLHYSIGWLKVPAMCVLEALQRSKISERRVCVKWCKHGGWHRNVYTRENHSRCLSLADLAMEKGKEVRAVVNERANTAISHVQITIANFSSEPWVMRRKRTVIDI